MELMWRAVLYLHSFVTLTMPAVGLVKERAGQQQLWLWTYKFQWVSCLLIWSRYFAFWKQVCKHGLLEFPISGRFPLLMCQHNDSYLQSTQSCLVKLKIFLFSFSLLKIFFACLFLTFPRMIYIWFNSLMYITTICKDPTLTQYINFDHS